MFREYWEDIGTIKSFYDANLALTEEVDFIVFIGATFHNSISLQFNSLRTSNI